MNAAKPSPGSYVVCVDCADDDVDLVVGKLYRVVRAERNDRPSMLRVMDDSAEDYLYPLDWFVPLKVPAKVRRVLAAI